jgi:TonB family protein
MNLSARFSREGVDWLEGLVCGLVHRAARNAPPALSERLAEEWLADLTARHGAIARLRFAVGCAWATRVIAHEMGVPAPAAAAATGHTTATVCVQPVSSFYSRRTMVLLLIVALHILVIYGLAAGMASAVLRRIPDVFQTTFIGPRPQPTPPAPLDVTLARVAVSVPRIGPAIDLTPAPGAIRAVEVQSTAPTVPIQTTPPPKPVSRVPGGPGADFPNTSDFYPDAARRLGEQGVATINVCVNTHGQLTVPPVVTQSSGSARLDAGGLKLARAGSGHYRATTEDGRPVDGCYAFRVRFDFRY